MGAVICHPSPFKAFMYSTGHSSRGQAQRDNQIGEVRVLDAAAIVEVDDFLKGGKPPVVHVGSRPGNLADRRSLEVPDRAGMLVHTVSTQIDPRCVPIDAKIMKFFVGEIETR